ncbi:hypothetical protein [Portibacter lacus]|nr:hypothetical protein [Portibacter lacus]
MSLNLDHLTLKRYGYHLGGFFLFFLLILSIYFFKERIIFLDNAFQTFLLIHEKSITIMVDRWPSISIRVLPLLAVKSGASLPIIMVLFSASYALFHLLVYGLTRYLASDVRYALVIPVTIALLTGHSFFWCASEILQAISLCVLILAITMNFYRKERWSLSVFTTMIGSIILSFYHPQSLICLIFGLLYLLSEVKWTTRDVIFPLICVVIFFLKSMLFPNWYDAMKFEGLMANIKTYQFQVFQSESFSDFIHWLYKDLLLYSVTFLISFIVLIRQKKYYKSLLLVCFTFALLLIYNVTNRDSMAIFYAEASYMPLAFFVAIPLLFDVIKGNRMGLYAIASIFILCLLKITLVAHLYSDRIVQVEKITAEHKESKVIISKNGLPEELKPITWGLPFETLLITTLSDKDKCKTIVGAASIDEYERFMGLGQFINGMGNTIKGSIDTSYFKLDTSNYVIKWKE